jgi:hypothetical protein
MDFSITKKNVASSHEITESSIYILQDFNLTESLGETRHGILKYSLTKCCGNKEIGAVTTTDCIQCGFQRVVRIQYTYFGFVKS